MTSAPSPYEGKLEFSTQEGKTLWSGSLDAYDREAEEQWRESLELLMHRARQGNAVDIAEIQALLCCIHRDRYPVLWSELRASIENTAKTFGFDGTHWRWIFADENPQVVDTTNFARQQMTGVGPWIFQLEPHKLTKPQQSGTAEKRPRDAV